MDFHSDATWWSAKTVCVCHCGNEPLALSLPSEPSVALEARIPVNTSQISFLFFSFCVSVAFRQTLAGRRRGLTATSPLPSSVFLSSFFPSFLWLLCLCFSLLPPFLLNWVVWQAGLSDSGVYVGSLRGRGHPPLCSQRRVSFSLLLLHDWTWPRLGPGGGFYLWNIKNFAYFFPVSYYAYDSLSIVAWF